MNFSGPGHHGGKKEDLRKNISIFSFTSSVSEYIITSLIVILSSVICYSVSNFIEYQIISFILLIVVSILALFYGPGPILLAATLSALIWDFFFIPPHFTLHIGRPEDTLMLVMFFIIALINGTLTAGVRRQEKNIRLREERTHALYQLTKDLITASNIDQVSDLAVSYIKKYFNLDCAILLSNDLLQIDTKVRNDSIIKLSETEIKIASHVYKNTIKAGRFTNFYSDSKFTFYPLAGSNNNMGVIILELPSVFNQGDEQFREAFISQISGKYEREYLRDAARKAYILNESDKLYKTLFNSISHELRIPVATIMGYSDLLLSQPYPEETKQNLYTEINTASVRLNRLIENLLNMSRLESGRIQLHPDWCDLHDLINKVADNLKQELSLFELDIEIPATMPLVYIDFGLMEQVLHNLVINATQYAPNGTKIRIKFFYNHGCLTIQVMDRGKGLSAAELNVLFNKFYRGQDAKAGGTGLGLSIVKGFIEAHGGTVIAENRDRGGAIFTIKIPVKIFRNGASKAIGNSDR